MVNWADFVKEQEKILGAETAQKWLGSFKFLRSDKSNIFLEAKDAFSAAWFDEHMRDKLSDFKVHISLAPGNIVEDKKIKKSASKKIVFESDVLDPLATKNNFITSNANEVTVKVIEALMKGEELGSFNPLYLYGHKGAGKTHLLMAFAKELKKCGKTALYVKAETFTSHVINAMRTSCMQSFRGSYRHVDVLILDDVHELSRRTATQEELFHTFNTLHVEGKQVVFSSLYPPRSLEGIEERLMSRFEWGICLPLEPLAGDDLSQMIEQRAAARDFRLKKEVGHFILEKFSSSTKVIEALETLFLRAHLDGREKVALGHAMNYLHDMIQSEEKSALSPEIIVKVVAEFFGVKMEDIMGKSQVREFVLPRQIAMYLCRERLKMPFTKIGRAFSRDHSTVMTSVKSIAESLKGQDKEIASSLSDIQRRITNC